MPAGTTGNMLGCMRQTIGCGQSGKSRRRSKAAWLEIVGRWRQSGQTAAEYAERHGLHAGTLAVWGSKLRAEVPAARRAAPPPSSGFLPVRLVDGEPAASRERAGGEIEVVLRNGRRVVVRGDFGNDALSRLLELAERGSAC